MKRRLPTHLFLAPLTALILVLVFASCSRKQQAPPEKKNETGNPSSGPGPDLGGYPDDGGKGSGDDLDKDNDGSNSDQNPNNDQNPNTNPNATGNPEPTNNPGPTPSENPTPPVGDQTPPPQTPGIPQATVQLVNVAGKNALNQIKVQLTEGTKILPNPKATYHVAYNQKQSDNGEFYFVPQVKINFSMQSNGQPKSCSISIEKAEAAPRTYNTICN